MKGYKKILLTIGMAAAFLLTLTVTAAAASDGKAEIRFERQTYDFGKIPEKGGKVTCEFTFFNDGKGNLVITDATAQCGCTKPAYPENPIGPGKSGTIKVTYNPLGRPGTFEKTVTVKSNGTPKKVRLKIKGEVMP